MTGIANQISITWRLICGRCSPHVFHTASKLHWFATADPKLHWFAIADPKLLWTFAAFWSSVCCTCYAACFIFGAQLERDGAQTRTVLVLPSPLPSCEPLQTQSNTIASRGRACLVAHFIHWRLGLIACMQDQEPENPCVYKTDCSTKSFTSLEQFTSPFCLSFPMCKNEIVFTFLPGILQGLISYLSLLERWRAFYTW